MSNSTKPVAAIVHDLEAEYMGYRYQPTRDEQDDCVKIFHDIVYVRTGKVARSMDLSPYMHPSCDEVRKEIDWIYESAAEQVANGITPSYMIDDAPKVSNLEAEIDKAADEVDYRTPKIRVGANATVAKGRKVPVGLMVKVFWVGQRFNKYSGQQELRAGIVLPSGEKVFVAAENLEPIPSEAEIEAYGKAVEALEALKAKWEALFKG